MIPAGFIVLGLLLIAAAYQVFIAPSMRTRRAQDKLDQHYEELAHGRVSRNS